MTERDVFRMRRTVGPVGLMTRTGVLIHEAPAPAMAPDGGMPIIASFRLVGSDGTDYGIYHVRERLVCQNSLYNRLSV